MDKKIQTFGKGTVDINKEIYNTMSLLYHGISKVNLEQGYTTILSSSSPEEVGNRYDWEEYLQYYVEKYILPSDYERVFSNFGLKSLRKSLQQGKRSFSCEFASHVIDRNEKHVTMLAFMPDEGEKCSNAYVLVRNTGGDYLLNSIVNQYVYSTCDYFIYLDAKHNSYTMFSGKAGTPLPPEICTDYETELVKYARAFVAKEDQEMVIREMHLERVLEQLDKHEIHSFTCGVLEASRGYARKRLDYRYHDRDNQMILLSRTDITDIYLEEEAKRKELEKALKRAQTDPLTKLLNFQATMDKVTDRLSKNTKQYVLLFIDLDNFKQINDTLGHPVGDLVLRSIASNLSAISNDGDIVGRVGGDEFVFFTELDETRNSAEVLAQRVCYAINSVKIKSECGDRVTGSVGIAIAPKDGNDYYALVSKADKGTYKAKRNGKNTYSF